MKLVVTAFVTVDGIIEAPGFDEHRSGRNTWALRVQTDEDQVYNKALAMGADAFLLGRRTWQIWAAFWPTASGGDPELTDQIVAHLAPLRDQIVSASDANTVATVAHMPPRNASGLSTKGERTEVMIE